MTSARIVTLGQARAMIPTMRARTPRRIKEFDTDLNMMMSFRSVSALDPRLRPGTTSRTHGKPDPSREPTPGINSAIGAAARHPGGELLAHAGSGCSKEKRMYRT